MATADCGGEAPMAAQQERFDAILTDLDLPDLAGEEVIRRLRGSPHRPSKVAAVTAAGEPALIRARQAGADEVFLKPVDVEAIVQFAAGAGRAARDRVLDEARDRLGQTHRIGLGDGAGSLERSPPGGARPFGSPSCITRTAPVRTLSGVRSSWPSRARTSSLRSPSSSALR